MTLAVVAIGRNEGERLIRCLDSVLPLGQTVVYVDSGSSDGSVDLARRRGVQVVELDRTLPFTAARARNAGFEKARSLQPNLDFVQFVDGDCQLIAGWLERGEQVLKEQPSVAVVCGRVRELHRDRTIYNRLCDLEWDGPVGEVRQSGGNAMIRARAFQEVGGFLPQLIAGEEPEMCLRLRQRGWKIVRVGSDMVFHDAAMTHFSQWWRRALRSGWGYAEGAALRGGEPERYNVRQDRSVLFWGTILPAVAFLLAWPTRGLSALLLAGYPVLAVRIYRRARRRGLSASDARLQAVFTVLAKFPQAFGRIQFQLLRLLGRTRRIVDWRTAG